MSAKPRDGLFDGFVLRFPDPTPFRQAAVDSGAPVSVETRDGGLVVYYASGAVIAFRRVDDEELDRAA